MKVGGVERERDIDIATDAIPIRKETACERPRLTRSSKRFVGQVAGPPLFAFTAAASRFQT